MIWILEADLLRLLRGSRLARPNGPDRLVGNGNARPFGIGELALEGGHMIIEDDGVDAYKEWFRSFEAQQYAGTYVPPPAPRASRRRRP